MWLRFGHKLPIKRSSAVLEAQTKVMNDLGRFDKRAVPSALHYSHIPSSRRMRNTAFLVKWIEDHQANPYPTKAEKQYLGYYSGMNLTQLSTWFANARRRIKKIGMKVWLEGRSTFTVDFFPPGPSSGRTMTAGDSNSYPTGYISPISTNPYNHMVPSLGGYSPQTSTSSLSLQPQKMSQLSNGPLSSLYPADSPYQLGSVSSSSLYGSTGQQRSTFTQPLIGTQNLSWPSMPGSSQMLPTSSSLNSISAPVACSTHHNVAPIHSPLTAQVYSNNALRSQTGLDVSDYSYQHSQQSPDSQQILPECASTEPAMLQESPKNHFHTE